MLRQLFFSRVLKWVGTFGADVFCTTGEAIAGVVIAAGPAKFDPGRCSGNAASWLSDGFSDDVFVIAETGTRNNLSRHCGMMQVSGGIISKLSKAAVHSRWRLAAAPFRKNRIAMEAIPKIKILFTAASAMIGHIGAKI